MIPTIIHADEAEFNSSEDIYKVLTHSNSNYFAYVELHHKKYYISWFSPGISIHIKILEKEKYLLIGVDLRAIVLCANTGRVLFSTGLFSFFKGFEETSDLAFTVFCETEDMVINKNGLSISTIISHELEF